jgi:hypothetical protein
MRRTVWVRSSRKRAGRGLLTNGRVRVTGKVRKYSAAERAAVERRLKAEGRL